MLKNNEDWYNKQLSIIIFFFFCVYHSLTFFDEDKSMTWYILIYKFRIRISLRPDPDITLKKPASEPTFQKKTVSKTNLFFEEKNRLQNQPFRKKLYAELTFQKKTDPDLTLKKPAPEPTSQKKTRLQNQPSRKKNTDPEPTFQEKTLSRTILSEKTDPEPAFQKKTASESTFQKKTRLQNQPFRKKPFPEPTNFLKKKPSSESIFQKKKNFQHQPFRKNRTQNQLFRKKLDPDLTFQKKTDPESTF